MAIASWRVERVAAFLCRELYRARFRGKADARFAVTRSQLKRLFQAERLHPDLIRDLQDEMLSQGFVLIDLDDLFPCIEAGTARRLRRPPEKLFNRLVSEHLEDEEEDDVEEDIDVSELLEEGDDVEEDIDAGEVMTEEEEAPVTHQRGRRPMT